MNVEWFFGLEVGIDERTSYNESEIELPTADGFENAE
jgi:hypothetical protein